MGQSERHDRQLRAQADAAAAELRHRQALAPTRLAVHIAAAFGYQQPLWRLPQMSRLAYEGALRSTPRPYSGVVHRTEHA